MKKTTKVLGAAASAAIFAAGAAVSAPAVQAMDGNTSLASVLDVGNAEFDHSSKDFDILTKASTFTRARTQTPPPARGRGYPPRLGGVGVPHRVC